MKYGNFTLQHIPHVSLLLNLELKSKFRQSTMLEI